MFDDNMRVVARTERLLTKRIGEETVLYDLATDEAHLLSIPSAAVWELAGTPMSVADLRVAASNAGHAPAADAAIQQLLSLGLLEPEVADGISRRTMIKRAAIAAAVGVPLVTTILAPTPAAATAASACTRTSGQSCGGANGCCVSPLVCDLATCKTAVANGQACARSTQCASNCCAQNNSNGNKDKCVVFGSEACKVP